MKTKFFLFTLIAFIFFNLFGCSTSQQISQKSKIEIKNHQITTAYLKYVKANNKTLTLGNFGILEGEKTWTKIKPYWESVPQLKKLRNEYFDATQKKIAFMVKHDYAFKKAEEKARKKQIAQSTYRKIQKETEEKLLKKYPEKYGKLVEISKERFRVSNEATLEYIIRDYYKRDRILPINWIPAEDLAIVKNNISRY